MHLPPRVGSVVPGSGAGPFEIREGGEYRLAFSFSIEALQWSQPGIDNLILRILGDGDEPSSLGLQLWEYPGEDWYEGSVARGLWASGEAMGGARFLAPVAEGTLHQVALDFKASSQGSGFYVLFLDGEPIDARAGVSLIAPGNGEARIEVGLFRDGKAVEGSSEVRTAAVSLTETTESVLP